MITTAEFLQVCEADPRRVEAAIAALCPPPYLADYSLVGAMMMALPMTNLPVTWQIREYVAADGDIRWGVSALCRVDVIAPTLPLALAAALHACGALQLEETPDADTDA